MIAKYLKKSKNRIESNMNSNGNDLYYLASNHQRNFEFQEAKKIFAELIEMYSNSTYTYCTFLKLADISFHFDREKVKSLKWYNKAITIMPKCGTAYFNKAIMLYDIGKYRLALGSFELSFKYEPEAIVSLFYGLDIIIKNNFWTELENFNRLYDKTLSNLNATFSTILGARLASAIKYSDENLCLCFKNSIDAIMVFDFVNVKDVNNGFCDVFYKQGIKFSIEQIMKDLLIHETELDKYE